MKNYFLHLLLLSLVFLQSCGEDTPQIDLERIHGATMGTTYHITYEKPGSGEKIYTYETDSILQFINEVASTYLPSSLISQLNQGDTISTDTLDAEAEERRVGKESRRRR